MELRRQRNLGLDLVRVTEAAALAAGQWMGRGDAEAADRAASHAMRDLLDTLPMDGRIVLGKEVRLGQEGPLDSGTRVGTGTGPEVDLIVDAIDGSTLVATGKRGALSVAASAPRGTFWAHGAAIYMEKLVINRTAASCVVDECLDAPAGWTLALVGRVMGKPLRDMVVVLLDRPRHEDLIAEIREAGARVMLLPEGDIAAAILASRLDGVADVMMGTGGVAEGVLAACAVKILGGAMRCRLAPQSDAEREAVLAAGLDPTTIFDARDLVPADDAFFAATGVTGSELLPGVQFRSGWAETRSILLRGETRTRRLIRTEHLFEPEGR